jgi:hypothetical protein
MKIDLYAFIAHTFDGTHTHYDDYNNVEGYDGIHSTTLYLFSTEQERDDAIENMSLFYGEEAERGSYIEFVWVGELSDISQSALNLLTVGAL